MNKKYIWLIGLSVIIILCVGYWYYFSSPSVLPEDDELAEQINEIFPEANAETIQDKIKLDEGHYYIPFISSSNQYGASYWKWEKRTWKPSYIDTLADPIVWKLDQDDPSSYYFVWNLHPDNKISKANFYLIRDRNYQVSMGKHQYMPQFQLSKEEVFEDASYGVIKLPKAWINVISQTQSVEAVSDFPLTTSMRMYFAWTAYDEAGEEILPEHSNGSGFSNGGIDYEFVQLINETELE